MKKNVDSDIIMIKKHDKVMIPSWRYYNHLPKGYLDYTAYSYALFCILQFPIILQIRCNGFLVINFRLKHLFLTILF